MAEAKKRKEASLPEKGEKGCKPMSCRNHHDITGKSRAIAAKAAQVGEYSVQTAWEVKKADPEIFEQVKAGKITASTAKRALSDPQLAEQVRKGITPKRAPGRDNVAVIHAPAEYSTDQCSCAAMLL